MKRITAADGLTAGGVMLLTIGVAMYDWRVALIVCGLILAAFGILGVLRGG